jgi:hypothetical protein
MHGLINRALQRFAEDSFGAVPWSAALAEAAPGLLGFEAMLVYEDAVTDRAVEALARVTGTPAAMLLEDFGTYLVCHPNAGPVRRLLRFGGESFADFLHSLDDLPDRVRLAVPDLVLPSLRLTEHGPTRYTLAAGPGMPGLGPVLAGVLRAMADDYGALAVVEPMPGDAGGGARLSIAVAEAAFAEGRGFDLAPAAPAGEVPP